MKSKGASKTSVTLSKEEGRIVRDVLKEKRYSQNQIADIFCISLSSINLALYGRRGIQANYLLDIYHLTDKDSRLSFLLEYIPPIEREQYNPQAIQLNITYSRRKKELDKLFKKSPDTKKERIVRALEELCKQHENLDK